LNDHPMLEGHRISGMRRNVGPQRPVAAHSVRSCPARCGMALDFPAFPWTCTVSPSRRAVRGKVTRSSDGFDRDWGLIDGQWELLKHFRSGMALRGQIRRAGPRMIDPMQDTHMTTATAVTGMRERLTWTASAVGMRTPRGAGAARKVPRMGAYRSRDRAPRA